MTIYVEPEDYLSAFQKGRSASAVTEAILRTMGVSFYIKHGDLIIVQPQGKVFAAILDRHLNNFSMKIDYHGTADVSPFEFEINWTEVNR